jgi:hypothetical protein
MFRCYSYINTYVHLVSIFEELEKSFVRRRSAILRRSHLMNLYSVAVRKINMENWWENSKAGKLKYSE